MVVRKIFHVSDIHIKNDFQEWNVFKSALEALEMSFEDRTVLQSQYNIAVVTGDVFHVKNKLTPDAIKMFHEFTDVLVKWFRRIYFICGNHDCLLHNEMVVDTLNSLLPYRAEYMDKIFYLRNTCSVVCDNLSITCNSLLDDRWLSKSENPQAVDVCLYHGDVQGRDFRGFEYVLLGDIHVPHYADQKCNWAYAGSLMCQHVGEYDYCHGYRIWDVSKRQPHEFVVLGNAYGWYQIKFGHDGVMYSMRSDRNVYSVVAKPVYRVLATFEEVYQEILMVQPGVSKYLSMKVHSPYDQPKVTELVQFLSKRIASVNFYYEFEKVELEVERLPKFTYFNQLALTNENLIKYFDLYLESFVTNINPQQMESVRATFAEKLRLCNKFEKERVQWTIRSLTFENMFGYQGQTHIDFSIFENPGVVDITGNNSTGKSSLFDIILYALFQTHSRNNKRRNQIANDVLNTKAKSFFVSIVIGCSNGQVYSASHKGCLNNAKKLKVSSNFHENSALVNSENRLVSQRDFEKIIGTYEDFIFFHVKAQVNDVSLIHTRNFDTILTNLLNVGVLQEVKEMVNQDVVELEDQYRILKHDLGKCDVVLHKEQYDQQLKDLEDRLEQLEQDIDVWNCKRDVCVKEANECFSQIKVVNDPSTVLTQDMYNKYKTKMATVLEGVEVDKLDYFQSSILMWLNKFRKLVSFDCGHLETIEDCKTVLQTWHQNLVSARSLLDDNIKEAVKDCRIHLKDNFDVSSNVQWFQKTFKSLLQNAKVQHLNHHDMALTIFEELRDYVHLNVDEKIKAVESELQAMTKNLETLEGKYDELNDLVSLALPEHRKLYNIYLEELPMQKEREQVYERIDTLKKYIDKWTDHEYDANCKYCIQNNIVVQGQMAEIEVQGLIVKLNKLNADISLTKAMNDDIVKQNAELEIASKQRDQTKLDLDNLLNKYCSIQLDQTKYANIKKKMDKWHFHQQMIEMFCDKGSLYENKVDVLTALVESDQNWQTTMNKYLAVVGFVDSTKLQFEEDDQQRRLILEKLSLQKKLNDYDSVQFNQDVQERYSRMHDNLKVINDKVVSLTLEHSKCQEQRRCLVSSFESQMELVHNLGEVEDQITVLNVLIKGLSNRKNTKSAGLFPFILNDKLSGMNMMIDQILKKFITRTVAVAYDEKTNAIYLDTGDNYTFGGAEVFIINLALKLVLKRFSNNNEFDMLFLDEALSVLDKVKRKHVQDILGFLKQFYRLSFIISHENMQLSHQRIVTESNNGRNSLSVVLDTL